MIRNTQLSPRNPRLQQGLLYRFYERAEGRQKAREWLAKSALNRIHENPDR
jgi:hypothetical protein